MRQRTFQKSRQMGAWALTLGLRAAVETRRRLQINKPDPVIPVGPEIASTSAGANPEHEVSLADARDVSGHRLLWPRCLTLGSQEQLAPVQVAEARWLGPVEESAGGIRERSGVCTGISEKPPVLPGLVTGVVWMEAANSARNKSRSVK